MNYLYISFFVFVFVFLSYLYGFQTAYYKTGFYESVKLFITFAKTGRITEFDKYGRLISKSDAIEVNCPLQDQNTGVILAFGQSNSANHAEYSYSNQELENVYNFFDGKCYLASSPLLGASGADGEWISKTSANLISHNTYKKVVVVTTGVNGATVQRWTSGRDLSRILFDTIKKVSARYKITDIIFHQGEADSKNMYGDMYRDLFLSVKSDLIVNGISAPLFMSIASVCFNGVKYPNEISESQLNLVRYNGIYRGVNTDLLITKNMRYDGCHFNKEGQETAAKSLAKIIATYHSMQR